VTASVFCSLRRVSCNMCIWSVVPFTAATRLIREYLLCHVEYLPYHRLLRTCELANYPSHFTKFLNHDRDHDQVFEKHFHPSPRLERCTSPNRRFRYFLAASELDIRIPVVLDGRYVFIMSSHCSYRLFCSSIFRYYLGIHMDKVARSQSHRHLAYFVSAYTCDNILDGDGRNSLVANEIMKRIASTCFLRVRYVVII
jgi:hypothetical protein